MIEPKLVEIPAAGDPFSGSPTTADYSAARRSFRVGMNTGPDPYADPMTWLGGTDAEDDPSRKE